MLQGPIASFSSIPLSVLDLSPIVEGGTVVESFQNSVDLARHVEALGYNRLWLAEHHNIPGIASAATAVLIGHVAAATTTLRIDAGGIMLPNHSHSSSPNSSVRLRLSIPAASISALAVLPAPIN